MSIVVFRISLKVIYFEVRFLDREQLRISGPVEPSHAEKLGNLIRSARLQAEMTQQQLAQRSGTTRFYISRFKNNHIKQSIRSKIKKLPIMNFDYYNTFEMFKFGALRFFEIG